jgi:hypothetical protein
MFSSFEDVHFTDLSVGIDVVPLSFGVSSVLVLLTVDICSSGSGYVASAVCEDCLHPLTLENPVVTLCATRFNTLKPYIRPT